ncbi:hypothetical protein AGMMS49938_15910 [Fibrobacterales bacterium]|nr:hypothetical protein AGMMS49938_15910 [Fibrobacterales bacterium]
MANQQIKPQSNTTTYQTIAYQGSIPPPEMMEQFKKLDSNLPERIIRMAEKSLEESGKELDILRETKLIELDNQKLDITRKQNSAEQISKYNLRMQLLIVFIVLLLIVSVFVFAINGYETIAIVLASGSFLTFITNIIKGDRK